MTPGGINIRLPEDQRLALENLSQDEGRPVEELVNEAIKNLLVARAPRERSWEEIGERLREYRKRDPGFVKAKAAYVDAEASFEDPLEGTPIEGEFIDGKFRPFGPVQAKIRELLSA